MAWCYTTHLPALHYNKNFLFILQMKSQARWEMTMCFVLLLCCIHWDSEYSKYIRSMCICVFRQQVSVAKSYLDWSSSLECADKTLWNQLNMSSVISNRLLWPLDHADFQLQRCNPLNDHVIYWHSVSYHSATLLNRVRDTAPCVDLGLAASSLCEIVVQIYPGCLNLHTWSLFKRLA